MKQLTCVINVRNGAQYIRETLNSLTNQSCVPEILVVDNCSTDDTVAIVNEFPAAHLVHTPKPMTLGAARNFSVSHVYTPLIAWLDSDDLWHDPEFCRDYVDLFLENEKVVAVSSGTKAINSKGHVFHKVITADLSRHQFYPSQIGRLCHCVVFGDNLKEMLMHNRFIAGWCSYVFSTEAVRRAGLFDDTMEFAEDFDLVAKVVSQGVCVHIKKDMCSARFHPHRVTEKLDPEIISREIKQVYEKFAGQIGPKEYKESQDLLAFKQSYRLLTSRKSPVYLGQLLMYIAKPKIMAWVFVQLRAVLRKGNAASHYK